MSHIPGENTDLYAEDLAVEELDTVVAAGFTTAGSFASTSSFSCPLGSAATGSSFSSAGD